MEIQVPILYEETDAQRQEVLPKVTDAEAELG